MSTRTFQIDQTHSEATFQVRHLPTKVRGHFSAFAGTITMDAATPTASSVVFTIQAASINTNTPDRDTHLRSDDFFAVEQFPVITFTSTGITARGEQAFDVAGTLTMRGVTRAIVVPVSFLGLAKDPWGNERAAFEGEVTLNRKDFGLNWNAVVETGGFLVGDDVKVAVSIQAVADK
jgi:polyisoprenoid-binding protein YceI